ncbi:MAG: Crp/Fnr family transcriptional regulator [Chloroflexi bacterium]|nr:Crp/Fnr family transcriptional regulator [Chloroflexota bacterium]
MSNRPTTDNLIQQLQTNSIFSELDAQILYRLTENAHWREYAAGELIVLEGEAVTGLYYLQSGWLKIVKISPSGREQVLKFIEAGNTFNEVSVFTKSPNPATAIALEAAGVWIIRQESVLRLLREVPDFAENIIAQMAKRLLYLVSLVTDLSLRSVTARLARLILEDADGDMLHRPRWFTQAELAARLGTVPDVVQRGLRNLEKEGVIKVQRHRIHILDRGKLAEVGE